MMEGKGGDFVDKLFLLLAFVLAFCGYRLYLSSLDNTLRYLVSWCAAESSMSGRCNLSLWAYVCNAQIEKKLPKQYALTSEERDDAELILKAYQKDLSERYFAGCIKPNRAYSRLRGQDYFMLTLRDYLHEHECDLYMGERVKYNLISRKDYGSWGGQLYDAEYELTIFGRVYHKLMFIAELYSAEGPVSIYIKDGHTVLDSNRIQISRM